ncbi:hypothetical protein D7030_01340 [Flavobacteriaceae bacterium AU392]|nr:hypothetical protein D1817_07795 [Flavobacteriaceae bacterium]RKM86523.1 hypothetical protein D7030_01340 [Flavobacteriaceae bacterium AU392]
MPLLIKDYNFSSLGSLGDTVGGFLNPIIAISAAMLTFLAFYIQYQANIQVQKQFLKQQYDDSINFEYNKLKERIYLIINEVDNFNVAFHEGKLISKLNEIPKTGGKKYNFSGVQGLNLFLIEYFRDKKEKEKNKDFKFDDSFHSVALNINNLLILFYNAHITIMDSSLKEPYHNELIELLAYVYYFKIGFLVEHYIKNDPSGKLFEQIIVLKNYYSTEPEK